MIKKTKLCINDWLKHNLEGKQFTIVSCLNNWLVFDDNVLNILRR